MFGSFLLGFIGWVLQLGSLFFILLGVVLFKDGGWVSLLIAAAMIFVGSYLKYLSKQSVRVRP